VLLNTLNSDSTPINLSGYTSYGFVKSMYSNNSYIYNLNPTPVLPFESGIIAISGNPVDTSFLPVGSFLYDVEVTNGYNSLKVLQGDFNIYPSTAIAEPSGGFITAQTGAGATITVNNYFITSGATTSGGISYSSLITSLNIILTGYSNYIFTGNSNVIWTLPSISNSINSNYFIKNRGSANVTLTGTNSDLIYSSQPVYSFVMSSGQAYILNNDGTYWNIN